MWGGENMNIMFSVVVNQTTELITQHLIQKELAELRLNWSCRGCRGRPAAKYLCLHPIRLAPYQTFAHIQHLSSSSTELLPTFHIISRLLSVFT